MRLRGVLNLSEILSGAEQEWKGVNSKYFVICMER